MKVVVLTDIYPNDYGKSDGIFVRNQVKVIEKMGIEVNVIYVDLRSFRKKRKWGLEKYQDGATNVYHYSLPIGPIPILLEFLYVISLKKVVIHYIKMVGKPDVLHGHFYLNGFWADYFLKKYGIRTVLTEHSSELYQEKIGFFHRRLMRQAYDNANVLISVSEALKRRMQRYTSNEIRVIPNALAKDFYFEKSNAIKKESAFTFLFIGHVIKTKGIELLITSFEVMQKACPNISLKIVGNGNLLNKMKAYVKERDLNVSFMGEVSHSEIPFICRQCDCFVLPSEKETFGVSYIEAMACGLPVIATKCGGPEEFVNDTNGMLIPVNDAEKLLWAMQEMYESKDEYNPQTISQNIIGTYGEKAFAKELIYAYENMI